MVPRNRLDTQLSCSATTLMCTHTLSFFPSYFPFWSNKVTASMSDRLCFFPGICMSSVPWCYVKKQDIQQTEFGARLRMLGENLKHSF